MKKIREEIKDASPFLFCKKICGRIYSPYMMGSRGFHIEIILSAPIREITINGHFKL